MKVYFYTPQDVGLEKFQPGLMRLEGFDRTENPANADLYCLPSIMHHFSKEVLLNLKYLSGNEERHIVWDLADDFRTFGVPWIAIRCACTKMMLEADPTTIAWPWPVEPLPFSRVQQLASHAAILESEFEYDVSFWGWRTPLDRTDRACKSIDRIKLKSLIRLNDFFFGYKKETDNDYQNLRCGFVTSLWQSRLALVPASIDGVIRYRLLEQMSMGRGLPVHICDNAVLPWQSEINWDLCHISIPETNVDNVGALLVEWLAEHGDEEIRMRAKYAQEMFNEWLHRDKWDALFARAVTMRLEGKI